MSVRADLIREQMAREWELAQARADRETGRIIADYASRGRARTSSVVLWKLYENDFAVVRQTLEKRIALESEHPLAPEDAEAERWADVAEGDIRLLVGEAFGWLARRALSYCGPDLSGSRLFEETFRGRLERDRESALAYFLREISIVRKAQRLNKQTPAAAPTNPQALTVNIADSTIAALNLGMVVGDITASISVLRGPDQRELAEALQRLAEAVGGSKVLPDPEKAKLLEHVGEVAEQATEPVERRRPAVIRTVLGSLGAALRTAADVAAVWEAVRPLIERYFGIAA